MNEAQNDALRWLEAHNGDGVFDRNGVLLAAGESAPVMRATWNALINAGQVETYLGGRRLRIPRDGGRK